MVDAVLNAADIAAAGGATGVAGPYLSLVSGTLGLTAGSAGGLATLGADGKLPEAQLPALAITDAFAVASEAAMLALTAQRGDVAIRSDLNRTFVLQAGPASVLSNWLELRTPTDAVLSVAGRTGAVALTTGDIAEGANLYFSDARARAALTGAANTWGGLQSLPYGARVGSGIAAEWYTVSRNGYDGYLEIHADQATYRGVRILYQGVTQFELDPAGLVKRMKLASASPGAGAPWFDPMDGNRVKYTP
jgi:hypothetical protein